MAINYTDSITSSNLVNEQSSIPKPKVHWTKLTKDEINENYTAPLLTNLLNIDLDLLNGTENDVNTISDLILTNSKSLAASVYHKKNKKKNYVSLPVDTVWIDGLLLKLFTEFGIEGRMWLAIKDLYTGVKAQLLYSGSLSRSFDVSQGTGQGRILAPFMHKVYINSLQHVLSDHNYAICTRSLQLTSPSFADDITLLAFTPILFQCFHGHVSSVQHKVEI